MIWGGLRIEGGLLSAQVRVPHVGDGAMAGLELLDHRAVLALADQVGRDEAGRAVHLGDLVGQHVAVVVVGRLQNKRVFALEKGVFALDKDVFPIEKGWAVHLRHLVGQHVAVVVVRRLCKKLGLNVLCSY